MLNCTHACMPKHRSARLRQGEEHLNIAGSHSGQDAYLSCTEQCAFLQHHLPLLDVRPHCTHIMAWTLGRLNMHMTSWPMQHQVSHATTCSHALQTDDWSCLMQIAWSHLLQDCPQHGSKGACRQQTCTILTLLLPLVASGSCSVFSICTTASAPCGRGPPAQMRSTQTITNNYQKLHKFKQHVS